MQSPLQSDICAPLFCDPKGRFGYAPARQRGALISMDTTASTGTAATDLAKKLGRFKIYREPIQLISA